MSKTTNLPSQTKEINDFVEELTLANHPETRDFIFNNLKIDKYLKNFPLQKDKTPFTQQLRDMLALNCYEGSIHQNLSNSDTRVIILVSYFMDRSNFFNFYDNRKRTIWSLSNAKAEFKKTHENVDPTKRITDAEYMSVMRMLTSVHHNTNLEFAKVFLDSMLMFMYASMSHKTKFYEEIIRDKRITFQEMPEYSLYIQLLSDRNQSERWKTRWAKMKSFKLNYPKLDKELLLSLQTNKLICQDE